MEQSYHYCDDRSRPGGIWRDSLPRNPDDQGVSIARRIIVALDFDTADNAEEIVDSLGNRGRRPAADPSGQVTGQKWPPTAAA
jgi:hypothetical protein